MLLFGLWPAEFTKGSRLQKFCVDRLLPLSMTFQVNTKNWTTTFLPQIISVYYLWHCSGRYFYISAKQAKIKFKKPHKPSHYIYMLLYAPSIQNTGYGRTLLYLAPTSGCVLRVCKGRHRGCSSCHTFNQKSYAWWWLFSGKDKKHLS